MHFQVLLASFAALSAKVSAVTGSTEAQMDVLLNTNDGLDLAYNYAPVFFFSEALKKVPTIPSWAFNGSLTQPDVYDPAHQTYPAPQCQYPDVGCKSRNPGVPKNSQIPEFPIYYTWSRCGLAEIRVVYNLYYQKDGAKVAFIETGHGHDWERVIIVHSLSNGVWSPSKALYSAHAGYRAYSWGDIQNTLSTEDAEVGKGPEPNGLRNLDHPKVYVAWSKHAMYHDRKTRFIDVIAQSTDNAWRGHDWWRFVSKERYVYADRGTTAGAAMEAVNWGRAASDPVEVSDGVCEEGNGMRRRTG